MKHLLIASLALTGCQAGSVTNALSSPVGQLFCSIQMAGGGSFVAALTAAAIGGAAPGAAPLAVIATNAGKASVDADCAKAVASVQGAISAAPVSPPANPAGAAQVAIVAPASPVVPMVPEK